MPNQTRSGAASAWDSVSSLQCAEIAKWIRMNASPTYPIWRWNCSSASCPNGAATARKRATSANSSPIIASPVNPSATEKFVQNPWSG
jgi:hypothetical protein